MTTGQEGEFRDRQDAGRRLARGLLNLAAERPIVLALPRGGVPVAVEVARALGAELDLLFVRKLGAPGREELGIGAVVDGADPQLVLNNDIIEALGIGPDFVRSELSRQLAEIGRRREQYGAQSHAVDGRTVILVDDGIATGGTIRAALRALRRAHAGRIVLAVPVGPRDVVDTLRPECDELVCLRQPESFYAVGAHYLNFDQVTDAEVIDMLASTRGLGDSVPRGHEPCA